MPSLYVCKGADSGDGVAHRDDFVATADHRDFAYGAAHVGEIHQDRGCLFRLIFLHGVADAALRVGHDLHSEFPLHLRNC